LALVNPLCPNLANYRTFVYGLVLPAATPPYPYPAFPYAAGTVSAGTTATLTDLAAKWPDNEWAGCVLFDVTQRWGGLVVSNTLTVASFITASGGVQLIDSSGAFVTDSGGNEITATGNSQGLTPAPGDQYLIVQPSLSESLAVALAEVNELINLASPLLYTKAVYNLAADRLINFGVDVPGQTLLADARKKFDLVALNVGIVNSASDQGTSGSYVIPQQMQTFTMSDLQLMKTPFGRAYISIAQAYGPTLFGIS
jgi:hypothetical protein